MCKWALTKYSVQTLQNLFASTFAYICTWIYMHGYTQIHFPQYTEYLLLSQERRSYFFSGCTRTWCWCVSRIRTGWQWSMLNQLFSNLNSMCLTMQQQFLTLDDIKEGNNIDMVEYAGKVSKWKEFKYLTIFCILFFLQEHNISLLPRTPLALIPLQDAEKHGSTLKRCDQKI